MPLRTANCYGRKVPTILVNGDARQIPDTYTVAQLLEALDLQASLVAVELNRDVLSRSKFAQTSLADQDRLEIVTFVGGG